MKTSHHLLLFFWKLKILLALELLKNEFDLILKFFTFPVKFISSNVVVEFGLGETNCGV